MEASAVDCVTELFAYTYHLIDVLADEQPAYETVSKTYATLISRAKECGKSAGIPKKEFDEALFAVFAWVDEALLAAGWEYKNDWIRNSLQKKYYNTTNAGAEFFEHLEKLTPEDRSVLEVYDYCLASGFKGYLYEPYHQEKLDSIKKDTYKKLYGKTEFKIPGILFPESGTIDFYRRLKRKRWKGMSSSTSLFVLLPVLLFLVLYYFFNNQLMHIIKDTGILM